MFQVDQPWGIKGDECPREEGERNERREGDFTRYKVHNWQESARAVSTDVVGGVAGKWIVASVPCVGLRDEPPQGLQARHQCALPHFSDHEVLWAAANLPKKSSRPLHKTPQETFSQCTSSCATEIPRSAVPRFSKILINGRRPIEGKAQHRANVIVDASRLEYRRMPGMQDCAWGHDLGDSFGDSSFLISRLVQSAALT